MVWTGRERKQVGTLADRVRFKYGFPLESGSFSLGRWLVLGLEFALAADILRTAVAPTWRDIGQLAAIAVLRTGLNYSLELEIAREEGRAFTCAARASSD